MPITNSHVLASNNTCPPMKQARAVNASSRLRTRSKKAGIRANLPCLTIARNASSFVPVLQRMLVAIAAKASKIIGGTVLGNLTCVFVRRNQPLVNRTKTQINSSSFAKLMIAIGNATEKAARQTRDRRMLSRCDVMIEGAHYGARPDVCCSCSHRSSVSVALSATGPRPFIHKRKYL